MMARGTEGASAKMANRARRRFLRAAALMTAGVAGSALSNGIVRRAFAAPPTETGLSFEGLLKGLSGFQPRTLMQLPRAEIPGFLSRRQLGQNYAVYREQFARLQAAESALATAPRSSAQAKEYAELRNAQMTAANSVLLHEFYFRILADAPTTPSQYLIANMNEHMGAMADWREDFSACARGAEEWAMLVYDPYDDRWHNVATGAQNAGGWTGANPLVVCDVADHAWSIDYRSREIYVTRFLDHLDWAVVGTRYRAVDRQ